MATSEELLLQLDDPQKCFSAALLLGLRRHQPALPRLLAFLTSEDADMRWAATSALGLLGDASALPALDERMNDEDLPVWHAASQAIKRIRPSRSGQKGPSLDTDLMLWLMDRVKQIIGAERTCIAQKYMNTGELKFRAGYGADWTDDPEDILQLYAPLFNEVAQTGQPILTTNGDLLRDARFESQEAQSLVFMALRSIMLIALAADNKIIGVIYADKPLMQGPITLDDLNKIRLLGEQVATVLIEIDKP